MNATISMDGLWDMIKPLSRRNKKWLADKLTQELSESHQETEEEIMSAIARGLKDVKAGKTYPIDTLWDQLKQK